MCGASSLNWEISSQLKPSESDNNKHLSLGRGEAKAPAKWIIIVTNAVLDESPQEPTGMWGEKLFHGHDRRAQHSAVAPGAKLSLKGLFQRLQREK